jgi:hypothetical protein
VLISFERELLAESSETASEEETAPMPGEGEARHSELQDLRASLTAQQEKFMSQLRDHQLDEQGERDIIAMQIALEETHSLQFRATHAMCELHTQITAYLVFLMFIIIIIIIIIYKSCNSSVDAMCCWLSCVS